MSKPDQRVRWSKREKALLYGWNSDKPTSMFIAHYLEGVTYGDTMRLTTHDMSDPRYSRNLVEELDARGYDISTLRFSIQRKQVKP